MKAQEFCYWLQGSIELGNVKNFNEKQTQILKNHLDMVLYHEPDTNLPFIKWIKALYDIKKPIVINDEQTEMIKVELSKNFEHYIDKSYPAEQQTKLHDIHNAQKFPNVTFRC